jgi:hypothetical protein
MFSIHDFSIDYDQLFSEIVAEDLNGKIGVSIDLLCDKWEEKYDLMTPRMKNLCWHSFKTFEYLYDDYASLEASGIVPLSSTIESRVVGVMGLSGRAAEPRDTSRQRGWVGPTERLLGPGTDKGHFISHSIGGGLEINIFTQRRDINRGWSSRGKVYRSMEKYCLDNPGIFCFNRPIYLNCTSRPGSFDFGLLMTDGKFWVEHFDN